MEQDDLDSAKNQALVVLSLSTASLIVVLSVAFAAL
jgi:hypothetical protein